ncbi:trypsin-like serine protease [Streptomyces sp. NPDC051597]|uniref:trypsin-like serine protease n=1 Tax=Streptomyces sp. NPDC051597 TaxID=3155049 RepID=UPI003441A894
MSRKSSYFSWATALLATLGTLVLTSPPSSALSGGEVSTSTYAFTVKLNMGERSACSGVLVDPQWLLTAASCFTVDGKPAAAGRPAVRTTATVGRTDLTQTGGDVIEVANLVPHADRDLMMAQLTWPATGVDPVKLATSAPTPGEQLTSLGFGRTKTDWVPDKLHSGAFAVASVDAGTVALNSSGGAVICRGDAGGPALRVKDGRVELAAINSRSWQGGCLGTNPAETRTSAVAVRIDNAAPWISHILLQAATEHVVDIETGHIPGTYDGTTGCSHTFPGADTGVFLCGSTYTHAVWNDGRHEYTGLGTDHAVWTSWQDQRDGTFAPWGSMGGHDLQNGVRWIDKTPTLQSLGGDNRSWCRTYGGQGWGDWYDCTT